MGNLPKYFTDGKTVQKKAKLHEQSTAKDLGGKRQKGSGAQTFHKGDVKTQELLVENKMTANDSLSVKKEWLIKIFNESVSYNKIPALAIQFEEMPGIVPKNWVAVPQKTMALLMECYKQMTEDDGTDGTK